MVKSNQKQKNQGITGHENLLEGSVAVDQENLWKSVYENEPVLVH